MKNSPQPDDSTLTAVGLRRNLEIVTRILVTLSGSGRLSASALRVALLAFLIPACSHVQVASQYGFRLNSSEDAAATASVDEAWFEIANRATKTYSELARVLLMVRQLSFRIEFDAQGDSVTGDLIRVRQSSECLPAGALLPIMGALVGDFLARDVSEAVLGAANALFAYCPNVASPDASDLELPEAPLAPESVPGRLTSAQ